MSDITYTSMDSVGRGIEEYLRTIKHKLIKATDSYPDVKSVYLSFKDLERVDSELANILMMRPGLFFHYAEKIMLTILPGDVKVPLKIRLKDIPTRAGLQIPIRYLTSKESGQLVSVDGLVRKVTGIRPILTKAAFMCERCGSISYVVQEGPYRKEPLVCDQELGGCGSSAVRTRFKLLTSVDDIPDIERITGHVNLKDGPALSDFEDTQIIEAQELHENLKGGEVPQRLLAIVTGDLLNKIMPGNRVMLTGILRSRQRGRVASKSNYFDLFMDVLSVHILETEYEEIIISDEDIEKIKALSEDPEIRPRLLASIAPEIYGLEDIKEAIMLQMFGGLMKVSPTGMRVRGDIHILLIGDPGTAKSQILYSVSKMVPRGIYASGKSSSAAGLTAAATKDPADFSGESRWTLEAGALVLADMGVACVDELDKMRDTDRDSIHPAMEQQRVTVHKAGISAELQSRCGVLAAANPTLGRFDPHKYLPEQIDLDPPLLTRFDVIFTLTDKADENEDQKIAQHILDTHFMGETKLAGNIECAKKVDEILNLRTPPMDLDFLRKYIAYAKKTCFPIMTEEAMNTLNEYYVSMRRRSEGGAIPLTPRNLEAMIRLAEASARMHLRPRVNLWDVETAIRVVTKFLEKLARSEDGCIDADIISTGFSSSERDRIWVLLDIIKDIQGAEGAPLEDILRICEEKGLPRKKVQRDLDRMKGDGRIYERGEEKYRLA